MTIQFLNFCFLWIRWRGYQSPFFFLIIKSLKNPPCSFRNVNVNFFSFQWHQISYVILHLLTMPILSSSENARQHCFIHAKTISCFFHSLDKKHSIKLNDSTAQAQILNSLAKSAWRYPFQFLVLIRDGKKRR